MPAYAYGIFAAGVIIWFAPFVVAHRKVGAASTVDRRARWGVLLQFVAYSLLWQGHFWTRPLPIWRTLVCILLFAIQPRFPGRPRARLEATCVWTPASAQNTSLCVQERMAWSGIRFTHPCCWCCAPQR